MSTYEPGTVAVATVRGKSDVRVMFSSQYTDTSWVSAETVGAWGVWHRDVDVIDVRPLVVLDLDPDSAKGVVNALRSVHACEPDSGCYLHTVADQIEEQTKPPRIPEPGWGVIVEARVTQHDKRLHWQRVNTDSGAWWYCEDSNEYARLWAELLDPIVIRDGIQGAS